MRPIHFPLIAAVMMAGFVAPFASARENAVPISAAPAVMTLERVFASPGIAGAAPRGVKLSPDGRFLTMLRNRS